MRILLLLVVAGVLLLAGRAEERAPLPPESRQFDFWVGDWEVFGPKGKHVGFSRIEKIADGAGLLENWEGAGGISGKSLNAWVASRGEWRQFWIDRDDTLELRGGLNAQGEMVLRGETPGVHHEIRWTPNSDGTVRQVWSQSRDGGTTWTKAFEGIYRPRRDPAGNP